MTDRQEIEQQVHDALGTNPTSADKTLARIQIELLLDIREALTPKGTKVE